MGIKEFLELDAPFLIRKSVKWSLFTLKNQALRKR